ncbi:hypothetical protein BABINDRAFT_159964 [Babjeviella inositovora NRRL Y-12698]|uniref:Uncharacterized protein n=1 Tax=Babjeviella inositovora NRRL Y-12698 TaxID=984486 RepID=A0A1E3QXA0_9ASCO|nr:uncharacterized protein BABINDRAFT_159964 [Babjeviella inositovora NRRL Y-12698]ODQ81712.1 hypothetical protein BABINDRAFT_159964 [Babjeviella inositovora NRRL Y-12698]
MCDVYVALHIATTCDEHAVYVTRDSAEIIELAWVLVDATTLVELHRDSVLVKPVNTPITPLCTSLTSLTWEHVRAAGTFKEAVLKLDQCVRERVLAHNLSFALVAFHAWDIRVQLPREARDKAVVLPPYLQHARAYDLQKEYAKWQAHHPESLSYSPSSLTNICTALEVEPETTAAPRRAQAAAATVARAVAALAAKRTSPEDRADVLTRPYDARADVKAFLAERSKILYMSNLPHDTTQSELESWFTQYGGRPIAFWTLKTPEQHKSTGSGFAVFATHEEAAEALAMNGRALNDRAVEVQPSSARVLDRAQDILTPFPPSKNRPRPGDWTCPSCGFSNFQRRTACFRCSFPAASAAAVQESMYGYTNTHAATPTHTPQGNYTRGISSVPFRAGDWKCANESCAYHNFAKNVCCLRCGAPRVTAPLSSAATQPQYMQGTGHTAPASHSGSHTPDSLLTSFQRQYPQGYSQATQSYPQYNGSPLHLLSAQYSGSQAPLPHLDIDNLSQQLSALPLGMAQQRARKADK